MNRKYYFTQSQENYLQKFLKTTENSTSETSGNIKDVSEYKNELAAIIHKFIEGNTNEFGFYAELEKYIEKHRPHWGIFSYLRNPGSFDKFWNMEHLIQFRDQFRRDYLDISKSYHPTPEDTQSYCVISRNQLTQVLRPLLVKPTQENKAGTTTSSNDERLITKEEFSSLYRRNPSAWKKLGACIPRSQGEVNSSNNELNIEEVATRAIEAARIIAHI